MLESFKIEDLKDMSNQELTVLAKEIRDLIIQVTSENGGHLASNLGIVELTICLHKVFNSPYDKLIFDVSHQTYAHKILTGRYLDFPTLRKLNGISGFAKEQESIHDVFEGGHSSTSISAALGFSIGKSINKDNIGDIVCIVGDASISNGLCFEALNYLGAHPDEKIIIIINDNNMSISKNVGILAKKYNSIRIKNSFKLLRKIVPVRIKHALQYYAYKVDLFTSMGFKYFENIDGHNFQELTKYLSFAKNSTKSTILHIKTIKGKGYKYSEEDTLGVWHGVGPFDITTGQFKELKQFSSFGEVLSDKLNSLVKTYNNIRVISPATVLGSGISSFFKNNKEYLIDVGIAEENALVIASSLSKASGIPVVFIYATFLQRAYDELIHDIARSKSHVVLCVDRAGIVPYDGDTHQGIYDMAFYNSIPGLTILQPTTGLDATKMLEYAITKMNGPVIIRYPKGIAKCDLSYFNNDLSWNLVKESSNKQYIVSYGPNVLDCLEMIDSNNDIISNIGLVNALCTTPIDEEMINKLNHSTLYIYEEVIKNGSLYDNLLRYIFEHRLDIRIYSISLDATYLKHGSLKDLKSYYHVSIDDLKRLILKEA